MEYCIVRFGGMCDAFVTPRCRFVLSENSPAPNACTECTRGMFPYSTWDQQLDSYSQPVYHWITPGWSGIDAMSSHSSSVSSWRHAFQLIRRTAGP